MTRAFPPYTGLFQLSENAGSTDSEGRPKSVITNHLKRTSESQKKLIASLKSNC